MMGALDWIPILVQLDPNRTAVSRSYGSTMRFGYREMDAADLLFQGVLKPGF